MTDHICPSCHCLFHQEFMCTTCGAEKLKDESTRQLERALKKSADEIDRLRNKAEMDYAIMAGDSALIAGLKEELRELKDDSRELRLENVWLREQHNIAAKELDRLSKIEAAARMLVHGTALNYEDDFARLEEVLK